MKNVALCFLTYSPSMEHPRVKYAEQCLRSLVDNLSFIEGNLHFHIADDGSPKEHVNNLVEMLQKEGHHPSVSLSNRTGYGGNMNFASQIIHSLADYVMPVEEDWNLIRPFDISDLVQALEASSEIECIRLGYLGWTNDVRGKLVQSANQTFMLFDPNSPETHIFAGHPRLESVEFERRVGAWPQNIGAGWTEMEICNRLEARKGVAWPLDAGVNASQDYSTTFEHIGDKRANE